MIVTLQVRRNSAAEPVARATIRRLPPALVIDGRPWYIRVKTGNKVRAVCAESVTGALDILPRLVKESISEI